MVRGVYILDKEKMFHDIALKIAFEDKLDFDPQVTCVEKEYLRKYITAYENLKALYGDVVRENKAKEKEIKAFVKSLD